MFSKFDYISIASLVISLMAVSVTLIRYKKKVKGRSLYIDQKFLGHIIIFLRVSVKGQFTSF